MHIISPRIADLWLSPFCHLLCGMNLAFYLIFTFNWYRNHIKESFRATLLPPPKNEAEGPTGFGISLEDLWRGCVPIRMISENIELITRGNGLANFYNH